MQQETGSLQRVYTNAISRSVYLRKIDRQAWSDCFTGRYHVPPETVEPETVLDLGANIGLTTAHYQAMWPKAKIVAVEMSVTNAALIPLNAPDATLRIEAVTDDERASWGTYQLGGDPLAYAFVPCGTSGETVQAKTLGRIIDIEFGRGGEVEFVKMDIEGAEWGILAAADGWRDRVRSLLVELHDSDISPDVSMELLVRATRLLALAGFDSYPHDTHPRAVFAWR
jgi:FkbM family methyltransferase